MDTSHPQESIHPTFSELSPAYNSIDEPSSHRPVMPPVDLNDVSIDSVSHHDQTDSASTHHSSAQQDHRQPDSGQSHKQAEEFTEAPASQSDGVRPDSTSSIPQHQDTSSEDPLFSHALSSFYEIALKHGTDKVTTHSYQDMYTKYFEPNRLRPLKFLEIGLGCDMLYGPGKSYAMWLEYFPNVDLHFIEYDAECVEKWKMHAPEATIYSGDQADEVFLREVIAKSGGDFDYIVDDGGHTMEQNRISFEVLMPHVKTGGMYFIEDLQTSYDERYGGGIGRFGTMVERIKVGIDGIMTDKKMDVWNMVRSVDCMREVCGFTKM